MRAIRSTPPFPRESGAVLLEAVMMLLLAGLLTLFALEVGVFEQRSTGNDVRERAVTEVAEAGLAQGFEYLMRQHADLLTDPSRWEPCPGDDTFPCGAITAASFDHDGDAATPEVSRRTSMYRLKEDATHVIPGIDAALS